MDGKVGSHVAQNKRKHERLASTAMITNGFIGL